MFYGVNMHTPYTTVYNVQTTIRVLTVRHGDITGTNRGNHANTDTITCIERVAMRSVQVQRATVGCHPLQQTADHGAYQPVCAVGLPPRPARKGKGTFTYSHVFNLKFFM